MICSQRSLTAIGRHDLVCSKSVVSSRLYSSQGFARVIPNPSSGPFRSRISGSGANCFRAFGNGVKFFSRQSKLATEGCLEMSSLTGIVRFCFSLELLRSSKSRVLFTIALTAVFMGLGMSVASAQSTFGSILGAVQDPSGAAVAACKVTITNKGTSTQRSAVADAAGNYVVTNLDPGNYEVSFEAPGFQHTLAEVELLARQTARIDGHLAVASQTETVNVEV